MKFLCEHCKAKYQIADDKVAGRTVRMKCRKCGNPIEVRAAVTETSTSNRAPQDPRQSQNPPGPQRQQAGAPRPLATSLSSTARPTRPPGAPRSSQEGHSQAPGALSQAFHRSQKDDDHSSGLDLRELSAADEWYVAINGVPVGPVRVAELRRKAALSVVTEDSLCWQEGMEEWRPVRAVTELAAVVREAAAGGRVSLMTSPAPPEGRPSAPPPAPRPVAPRGPSQSVPPRAPPGPAPKPVSPLQVHAPQPQQAVARSNVVPFASASRLATAEWLEEDAQMVAPDPFALPGPAPRPAGYLADSPRAPGYSGDAPKPAGQQAAATALPPIVTSEPPRRPVPWILLAMFVLAGAFGVTAALLVFKQQPPQVVVVPQQVTAPQAPPTATAPAAGADIPSVAPVDSAATAGVGSAKPVAVASRTGGNTAAASAPHPSSATTAATDPALQDLIRQTSAGPVSGPAPTAAAANAGGGSMTEAQITSVVMLHQAGVKRTCWERSSGTTASANVSVQIAVGPLGVVQSAQATGNDPVVAHCIENEVRGWKFPSGSSLPIVIPFHFVRQ